ncbi:MAG: non-hydrolyzing UDP-N-acetylglucosamine 2-epimerase [Bacteroidota bacterium]
MKILTVIGARPQFVKAAVVSREFNLHKNINEIIVHTGQHFDRNMSQVFFEEMQIPTPNYNLNINSLNHGAMTGQMLEGIEKILMDENPDFVMVYGDTNSTLAGALAAKKLNIKVAHVEAGLRSFNMKMPEEINRILTDRISDILFCPTDVSISNLMKEGFENFTTKIVKNGDVMLDAALYYSEYSKEKSKVINELGLQKFVLASIHRVENTDDINNLNSIIDALNTINKTIQVVVPLHPRTKNIIDKNNLKVSFTIIDPVGYFDMLELLKNCSIVITDSGGLQKEAFFFKKFCITMREQTEWIELVENGFNLVAGSDKNKILSSFDSLINKQSDFSIDLYGTGNSAKIIAESLLSFS